MSHPQPPADFGLRPATFEPIASGQLLRVHRAAYGPRYFGRTQRNRFDAPDKSYGVMYGAPDLAGCFAETVIRGRFQAANWPLPLSESELREFRVARCLLKGVPLNTIAFMGPGLLTLGGDARLHTEVPYATPQAWSMAAHNHAKVPDGILYLSRYDATAICVAVFERADPAIDSFADEGPLFDHPGFPALVGRYQITIA